jgi:GNAT superfamily N-acetyltransferase
MGTADRPVGAPRYAWLFERLLFGWSVHPVARLPAGRMAVEPLPPDAAASRADWLTKRPRLVGRFAASHRRALLQAVPSLLRCSDLIGAFPPTVNSALMAPVERLLERLGNETYGADRCVSLAADHTLYCTRRGHRALPRKGVVRVTRRNVAEIVARLQHGGVADDPQYLLDNPPAFACYEGGVPIGFCGCHPSPLPGRIARLGMVFVEEPYRRRGIAASLVSAVAWRCLESGLAPTYGCATSNPASLKTALAAGFRLAGLRCRLYVADQPST